MAKLARKRDPNAISIDEWLKELNTIRAPEGPAGFTKRDIIDRLGLSDASAAKRINQWSRSGRIVCVGRRSMTGASGVMCPVPVYRLKEKL